jgi:hypothetical protein
MKKGHIILFLVCTLLVTSRCTDENEPLAQQDEKPTLTLSRAIEPGSSGRTNANITSTHYGTYYSGDVMYIEWSYVLCGCDWATNLNIDLYKGSTYVGRIATDVPFFGTPSGGGHYDWTITSVSMTGSDFRIRITSTTNSSNWAESNDFTLVTPGSGCFYSTWNLSGAPSGYVPNNTTVQYQIQETGLASQVQANSPTMRVISYSPLNVVYSGTTYYCPGGAGVNIPITGTTACSGSNPAISAPLQFKLIGGGTNTAIVTLGSVSAGHFYHHGYHSFYMY